MVTRVEIPAEVTGAEAPEQAVNSDRPEWLPEKFNSPQDMAKAYGELETKIGSPKAEAEVENKVNEEEAKPEVAPEAEEAKEAVESLGLDFDAMNSDYQKNGELSEDAYKSLEDKGITKDIVDQFIKGQESLAQSQGNDVVSTIGGQEVYNEMINWAKDNMSPEDVTSYNEIVNGNNMGNIKLAVQGLKAQYENANGKEPSLTTGTPTADNVGGFRSWAEVRVAMSDPRYNADPAYRNDVAQKIGNSKL